MRSVVARMMAAERAKPDNPDPERNLSQTMRGRRPPPSHQRSQGPPTTAFSAQTTVKKERIGLGILATSDKIGSYSNNGLFASYAYRIKNMRGGVLSLGLQGGVNNFRADYSKLNLKAGQDPTFSSDMNEIRPNFGGGVYYYDKKYFAGFSVPTILTTTSFISNGAQQLVQPRNYFLTAGAIFPMNRDETLKFSPSFLIRAQDGSPLGFDLNINVIFYDLISVGSSYRSGDAVVAFVNFKLSEKLHFSYSYDMTTSDINRYSMGTHEFMLNYRVSFRGIHKDVECPYYFSH
jgi:type IX secretion system PorP/SprF family membrane protein